MASKGPCETNQFDADNYTTTVPSVDSQVQISVFDKVVVDEVERDKNTQREKVVMRMVSPVDLRVLCYVGG